MKPTKPGFYWYQEIDKLEWNPVEVLKDVDAVFEFGEHDFRLIKNMHGEWGPEIVHGETEDLRRQLQEMIYKRDDEIADRHYEDRD